ncbi:MAG: ABC transporter ATP-binding protein [Planctomycetota bacterium]|jgi:ABC-type sugar transport system ATPase subunit
MVLCPAGSARRAQWTGEDTTDEKMAEVRFDSVGKTYAGGVEAVRALSLDVPDGEFLVLVGPSGCGKSTILRMLAGLETITTGSIHIGDRCVNDVAPKDRDVAMVFQNYALYPHMTVYRNMAFGLRMRKVPRDEIDRRVRRVAEMLGIDELLNRKPRALSGGQQQRVAVGRTIVREPSCYLFDEPLSNLDARLRVEMRGELKSLHQRLRTTTVFVTHDQEEAMTLADRIVVLRSGVVQQVGRPIDVYRRPANRFVAGFMGSPPMNLVDGVVSGGRFTGGGLETPVPSSVADGPAAIGIRPEGFIPASSGADGSGGGATVDVTVDLCEIVGDRMDVHAKTAAGTALTARIPALEVIEAGSALKLSIDAAAGHVFEPGEDGRRLAGLG